MHYYISLYCCYSDITGKKAAIGIYLNNIKGRIDDLNDANTLDRVLALLTKASAAIKAVAIHDSDLPNQFQKKDHFFPTQKNETQLVFKKTVTNPGRKKQHAPMR